MTALVADSGHLSFQPEIVNRRTTVKAGRNDSVASIARRYKLNPDSVAEWNDVKLNHAFKRGYSGVVYLPVRAAAAARVGSGAAPARGQAAVAGKRGGGTVKAVAARGTNIVKSPAGKQQQVVREKRGGTPSKKKR